MVKRYYRYNINEPRINQMYLRYKRHLGVRLNEPLSDRQRKRFESWLDKYILRQRAREIN